MGSEYELQANHDLNRLQMEAEWNSITQKWQLTN